MSTSDSAKHAALGARQRGPYLIQQAGYTLAIAAAEGADITALLPAGHLEKTARLRDDLVAALGDKTVHAAEAKQATNAQNDQMHGATVWVRKVAKRCQNAIHLGVALPPEVTRVGSPPNVAGMIEQISKALAVLGERTAAMDAVGPPTTPLIDTGRQLFQSLQDADSEQEQAHAASLPAAVLAYYLKKAELYIALKIINNAGHELYAGNPSLAARFNLSILHRHGPSLAQPTPPPGPSPTPGPAPTPTGS